MTSAYGLDDFVTDLRGIAARHLPPREALTAAEPKFRALLGNQTFLKENLAGLSSHGDEVLLHHEPDDGFVVTARGVSRKAPEKGKSHAAVPHDHGSLWALYGLYEGTAQLQRYEPDEIATTGPFPGLRLIRDRAARAGDIDAIEPHNIHLPVFPPDSATIILVVYNQPLKSVVRRGYVPALGRLVEFRGGVPPVEPDSKLILAR